MLTATLENVLANMKRYKKQLKLGDFHVSKGQGKYVFFAFIFIINFLSLLLFEFVVQKLEMAPLPSLIYLVFFVAVYFVLVIFFMSINKKKSLDVIAKDILKRGDQQAWLIVGLLIVFSLAMLRVEKFIKSLLKS